MMSLQNSRKMIYKTSAGIIVTLLASSITGILVGFNRNGSYEKHIITKEYFMNAIETGTLVRVR